MELLFYLFEDQVWLKSINSRAERHGRNSAITGGKKEKKTFNHIFNIFKLLQTDQHRWEGPHWNASATQGDPTKSKQSWLSGGETAGSQPPPARSRFRCADRTCSKESKPSRSVSQLCRHTVCKERNSTTTTSRTTFFCVCVCDQINSFTEWVQKFSCCIPRIDPKFCHLA